MDVPRLTTDRLLLRGFEVRDFEAYATMFADPRMCRYLGDGQPLSRADAWRQMAMIIGHWTLRGYGLWAVEERASGRLIGRIGCYEPEGWPALEIGYTVSPACWGRGYATEGAREALRYARTVIGRDHVVSLIRPDNLASIRVATRLGASPGVAWEISGHRSIAYQYPTPPATP